MSLDGISGSRQYATEQAFIMLMEDGTGRGFIPFHPTIAIGLITNSDLRGRVPSLLGRDLMDFGSLVVNPSADEVVLDVPGAYLDEIVPS